MSKQVYISADYDEDGDRDVVDELVNWGKDDKHKVDFIDMPNPRAGNVSDGDDCRTCDLKCDQPEYSKFIDANFLMI